MNSRFYDPTNTGSLGEPRRVHNSASPTQQCPSSRFQAEQAERTPVSCAGPAVFVVDDAENAVLVLKNILSKQADEMAEAD